MPTSDQEEFSICPVCGEETQYKSYDRETSEWEYYCVNEDCPTNKPKKSNKSEDCIFTDYFDICKNDDCPYYGQYCSGHCAFYESK